MTPLPDLMLFIALTIRDDQEDHALAARIKEGDREAFKAFYEKYQPYLVSFLVSREINQYGAKKLLRQAFMIVWNNRSDIQPKRSLRAFLFRIAYNRVLNYFRDSDSLNHQSSNNQKVNGTSLIRETEPTKAVEALQHALDGMPEQRRTVFELCYLQQFTYRETADSLNMSVPSVEKHMASALQNLRNALKKYFPNQ